VGVFFLNVLRQNPPGQIVEIMLTGAKMLLRARMYEENIFIQIPATSALLGLMAIALCGYELGGYWIAFLAALALWLYPRYYGAIYNNPKDIPAVVTTTFVLWAVLVLIKQWTQKKYFIRNSVLLGVCIGTAASIRVTAVIWYLILAKVSP
jgi:hypothetical protein